jgi:hypothetical protein
MLIAPAGSIQRLVDYNTEELLICGTVRRMKFEEEYPLERRIVNAY